MTSLGGKDLHSIPDALLTSIVRSSGAFSLSIWTHYLNKIVFDSAWKVPGTNKTENVLITGSGNTYGPLFEAAFAKGRAFVTGSDATVGVGGHIQGGGWGPLTSRLGLAADQILEARVVTTQGKILVANALHNQDLLWALRGGGPGQVGVVTEYVLRTYPVPTNALTASLAVFAASNDSAATNATWFALGELVASFPDLVDQGVGGGGLANSSAGSPVTFGFALEAFNMTVEKFNSIVTPLKSRLEAYSGDEGIISVQIGEPVSTNFLDYFHTSNLSPQPAGGGHTLPSRLLGRQYLSDFPRSKLVSSLQNISRSNDGDACTVILTTPGGPGPRMVEEDMRGALNPAGRSAYAHIMSTGGHLDTSLAPQVALDSAAQWVEENLESAFREWAPDAGSYMNEANPFSSDFKKQFFGENYDRLLEIKYEYDPTDSLFEIGGVGSDAWKYDMNTGKLCCTNDECRGLL
jgi:hypothetical protein